MLEILPKATVPHYNMHTCQAWNISFLDASMAFTRAFTVPRHPLSATAAALLLAALAAAADAAAVAVLLLLLARLPTSKSRTSCTLLAVYWHCCTCDSLSATPTGEVGNA
jgi:hypothetical protein